MSARMRWAAVGIAIVLLCGVAIFWTRGRPGVSSPGVTNIIAPDERAPEGVRVRVSVLNATERRGLARRATRVLRDRGFDVVTIGNAPDMLDSTIVLAHTGAPAWAEAAARAMGGAAVQSRPDSSRYLDVTVLVGASWRPPPDPFHP